MHHPSIGYRGPQLDRAKEARHAPVVPQALVEHLASLFRPVDTTPSDSMAEIQYRAGQQSVIAAVRRWYETQTEPR